MVGEGDRSLLIKTSEPHSHVPFIPMVRLLGMQKQNLEENKEDLIKRLDLPASAIQLIKEAK